MNSLAMKKTHTRWTIKVSVQRVHEKKLCKQAWDSPTRGTLEHQTMNEHSTETRVLWLSENKRIELSGG